MGLRDALRPDRGITASFVLLPRVEIVQMLAASGFEAVIIDLEHGPITTAELPPLVAAAKAAGAYAVVRLASSSAAHVGGALDTGIDGVLVPHVSSREEAAEVVRAGRFPPAGERSLNPYVRSNEYGMTGVAGRDSAALIAMLEGPDAVDELEDLCAEGIDGYFLGPVDLASSLGLSGDAEHPAVVAVVAQAIERITACGCVAGVYAPTPDAGARWLDAGASLVAVSADIAMAGTAFSSARAAIAEARRTTEAWPAPSEREPDKG